jgi:DNA-binding CsgD family transcriptional regulator
MSEQRLDNVATLRRKERRRNGRSSVSAERISELIGKIYDCVLDPKNWGLTLEDINREFTFASSVLGVVPLHEGGHRVNVTVGYDPEWLSIADDEGYRADAVSLWGGAERAQRFPLDEPIVNSQGPSYPNLHNNRYFREFLEPRGLYDGVLIAIAREPRLLGYVGFNRHRSAGLVGDTEVDGLRLLGPHFRRAVTISNLFDLKAIEAATFGAALDALALGVALVDERLGLVHANAAAQAMLAEADPIGIVKGVLTLPAKIAQDALLDAVERAAGDEMALGQRGIGIPAPRRNGEPGVIHVLPLRRGEMRRGIAQRAVASLFIVPASGGPSTPTDALALLYNLTPAETRVFELTAAGKSKLEIAADLGVAPSTIKTQLRQVFLKSGCRSQSDVRKLAADLSL